MKTLNYKRITRYFGCILLAIVFSSCNNLPSTPVESKQEYIKRVFLEQTEKQRYYAQKFLRAAEKLDLKIMQLYKDSASMANYCSHNAYIEMQLNDH
jgi:hypothetical protein